MWTRCARGVQCLGAQSSRRTNVLVTFMQRGFRNECLQTVGLALLHVLPSFAVYRHQIACRTQTSRRFVRLDCLGRFWTLKVFSLFEFSRHVSALEVSESETSGRGLHAEGSPGGRIQLTRDDIVSPYCPIYFIEYYTPKTRF